MKPTDGTRQPAQLPPKKTTHDALAADDDARDVLRLSEKEQLILQLYDQTQDLQIELGVLDAHQNQPEFQGVHGDIEERIKVAENQLLESRATYSIKKRVEENIMATNPILRAVHATDDATIPERLLFPLLNRRDILSLIHENSAKKASAAEETLSRTEVENMKVGRKNQELVQVLLDLTAKAQVQRDSINDVELENQMEMLERDNQARRARWRTMRGVLGSIIVGSGVDWARDDELCSLVMDEE